ncbi:MAG: oligosaccharide repeat unit polymerase [Ignavibacteriales bacterium]|nr:oligosaccharide repeat unit polymerase [Ignavibacteriales bacterium]
MIIILIIIATVGSIILSRTIFGVWFTHVSLYAATWGVSLLLFELNLINYYKIEIETWIIIFCGWCAFILGAITVYFAYKNIPLQKNNLSCSISIEKSDKITDELRLLKKILWILNVITFLTTIYQWNVLINKFGSLSNVIIYGNFLYSYRVSEGLPGGIPYVSSLALTSILLAGVYTSKVGRLKIVAVIPFVIIIILEIASMGRAKLIMAGVLFFSGFYFMGKEHRQKYRKSISNIFKKIAIFIVAIAFLIIGAEFVRSTRGVNEKFHGASQTLEKLGGMSFITPSIYLYLTVHHGVFNQYLKHDGENNFWGSNTFAPLFRIMAKLGFNTHVETYQIKYPTPVSANTGTYLREFHADFGLIGVFICPYLLGIFSSFFWYRMKRSGRYTDMAVFSYLLVVIAMSLFYIATRSGDLLVCLIGSLGFGYLIDRKLCHEKMTKNLHKSPCPVC